MAESDLRIIDFRKLHQCARRVGKAIDTGEDQFLARFENETQWGEDKAGVILLPQAADWRLYTPSDMARVLRKRRIAFLGHSVHQHALLWLVCALEQAPEAGALEVRPDAFRGGLHIEARFRALDLKLEFLGGGVLWQRKERRHPYDIIGEVRRLAKEMRTRDVIAVNYGSH